MKQEKKFKPYFSCCKAGLLWEVIAECIIIANSIAASFTSTLNMIYSWRTPLNYVEITTFIHLRSTTLSPVVFDHALISHTLFFFCAKISSISRLLISKLGIVRKQKCANGSLDGCQLLLLPGWTFSYREKDPTGVVFGTTLLPAHSFRVYGQIIICPRVSSLKKYILSIYYE